MGIYGSLTYGEEVYGETPRFGYSVLPLSVEALDYQTVELKWTQPTGEWSELRLVRSNDGYADTPEDGQILVTYTSASANSFIDSPDNVSAPLVPGRFAFYRFWIYNTEFNRWQVAGEAELLVPKEHGNYASDGTVLSTSKDKLISLLPRMYFSPSQSPRDEIAESDLSKFLDGVAFTVDEIMTYADNLMPESSGRFANSELTTLRTLGLGLPLEPYIGTKNQKKLVRNANYIYQNKGTPKAVEAYVESLTGFAPIVETTKNLLLSLEDATFFKGLGNWEVVGPATLIVDRTKLPPAENVVPEAVDYQYSGLFESTGPASMRNGFTNPRTRAIPVIPSEHYHYQTCVFPNPGMPSANVYLTMHWHDIRGNLIRSKQEIPVSTVWGDWNLITMFDWAPAKTTSVYSYKVENGLVTLNCPTVLAQGETPIISVSGVDTLVDGTHTVMMEMAHHTGHVMITYQLADTLLNVPLTDVASGVVEAVDKEDAAYLSFEVSWDGPVKVNLDMTQVALMDHFAEGFLYSYEEPRGVKVTLLPQKTNLLLNPQFHPDGLANWTIDSTVTATSPLTTLTGLRGGVYDLELSGSPTLSVEAISPIDVYNAHYCFSVYARTKNSAPQTISLRMKANDGLSDVVTFTEENITLTDIWKRIYVRGYVPESIDPLTMSVEIYGATTDTILLSASQLETSYSPTDYFDGALPQSYGTFWAGEPHDSRSYIYPTITAKATRLAETLYKYVPFNCPIVVKTLSTVEQKLIPLKAL